MPIDFPRIQDVFQAVADLPADERAAVLERECRGDAELRRQVEALLKAHDDPGELPAAGPERTGPYMPAAGPELTGAPVPAVEPGQVFAGRYKLREKLGEGGMGIVFVADQTEPVQRRVALKIIRAGRDTHHLLARFEQERQALALMDHPNIAKVFDAGVDQAGRPYFAMELVKGLPLTKYCDDARLSPRQRLELFIPVCQAVQHAHQKGIIHRDLKPSNILIGLYDGRPVPKVIDFGVAKVTGPQLTQQSIYTEVGTIVGTLEYMAPEQAELNNLDIDTRSDIYALGVILYELLTGAVPFSRKELEKAGLAEMLRVIKEVEPPRPSTKLSHAGTLPTIAAQRQMEPKKLTALVRGELDWIVMKALEKDRGRRYETANGFGMDVQRYLAGEPVLAAPASNWYRLRKLVRRHRGPVVAAGLVLLTLVGGIGGTTWGLVQAEQQRDFAEAKKQEAVDERDAKARALKAEQQARRDETRARQQAFAALRSMTADVVEKKFTQGTVLTEDDRAFLRGVIAQYEAFAAIKGDDRDSRAVLAEGRFRVGMMRHRLGELKEAKQDYDQALRIQKKLAAEIRDDAVFRKNLAIGYRNRAVLLMDVGRFKEAEQDYDESLRIAKQLADAFRRPEFRQELADSHDGRGALRITTGRHQEAEQDCDQAVNIYRQLANQFPMRREFHEQLAGSHHNRGQVLGDTGRLQKAEQDYDEAIRIYKQLLAESRKHPELRKNLANSYNNRGNLLKATGRFQEAEQDHDQALRIRKQLAADYPSRPDFGQALAKGHMNRGTFLMATGRLKEAEKDYNQALSIGIQLVADFSYRPEFGRNLALSYNNRGGLMMATGRLQEAEQDYNQALSIGKKLANDFRKRPEFHQVLAVSHIKRAKLLMDNGRMKEAEQDCNQALHIQKQLVDAFRNRPDFRQDLATSHLGRGVLLVARGRLQEAEQDWNEAVSIQKRLVADFSDRPDFRQNLADSYNNRSLLLGAKGRLPKAEKDLNEAVNISRELVAHFSRRPGFSKGLASSLSNRGLLLMATGRLKEAEKDFNQAVSIDKQLVAEFPNHPDYRHGLAGRLNNRGMLLTATGRHKEAEKDHNQAMSIDKQLVAEFPNHPDFLKDLAASHVNRGYLLMPRGRLKEAEQDYDQAIRIYKQLAGAFPHRPEFRRNLAISFMNRGILLSDTRRLREAEKDWIEALSIQKQQAAISPNQPGLRNDVAGTCVNLAILHHQQGNWGAAKRLLLEGRPYHLAALKANAREPTYRQFYRNHLNVLTAVHAGLLEPKDAIDTAETRRHLGWNPPADAYDAACFLSRCIPIVAKHDKLNAKQRKDAAEFYGNSAMKLLRDAVRKGYRDAAHMKQDTGLDPLRRREEFQKLVAGLEGKGK
jgi:tetratricopeptide (TPR) repeat protein